MTTLSITSSRSLAALALAAALTIGGAASAQTSYGYGEPLQTAAVQFDLAGGPVTLAAYVEFQDEEEVVFQDEDDLFFQDEDDLILRVAIGGLNADQIAQAMEQIAVVAVRRGGEIELRGAEVMFQDEDDLFMRVAPGVAVPDAPYGVLAYCADVPSAGICGFYL